MAAFQRLRPGVFELYLKPSFAPPSKIIMTENGDPDIFYYVRKHRESR